MTQDDFCLFALDASRAYGERVASALGVALASHEEREFEDGEHKARPLENVRGRDVYVIHSLYGEPGMSANDKLVRLLFFIGTLKDASAARVTAVCPYLAYARKDRRTQAARSGQQPLCGPTVRSGGRRPRGDPGRAQPGRLSECLPHPGRTPGSPRPVCRLVRGTAA